MCLTIPKRKKKKGCFCTHSFIVIIRLPLFIVFKIVKQGRSSFIFGLLCQNPEKQKRSLKYLLGVLQIIFITSYLY